MKKETEREILERLLAKVRRRLFLRSLCAGAVLAGLAALPVAALSIALSQRWMSGRLNAWIALAAGGAVLAAATFNALRGLGTRVRSALALDERAHLKDRVSSAYEFLKRGALDEAQQAQIQDALRHAQSLNFKAVYRFQWPRFSVYLPIVLLVFVLSFLVPPISAPTTANAATDVVKQAQLNQLQDLQQELQKEGSQEVQEVLKKLQDIRKQFEKGEFSERDVLLQLARLDEILRQKTSQLGLENLEAEMNTIVPHLMSAAAAKDVAAALKENKLDKAADELQKLAEKVKQDKLSKEQKRELTMNLGVCASKLGGKENGSFGKDFANATEAMEKSDSQAFQSACKSMCDKLGLMKKCQGMKSACLKLGNCKSCLGQCESKELGFTIGLKQQGKGKGGLKAGTSTTGDPYGEANRLADGYAKIVKISGQAGAGPVESETEITEGQASQSQLDPKEVHANYAAVAEEVIEKEDIPLSHRYHVKRYFQAIRPSE
jgi:hypothetical protein